MDIDDFSTDKHKKKNNEVGSIYCESMTIDCPRKKLKHWEPFATET